jgi:hypothetical protein
VTDWAEVVGSQPFFNTVRMIYMTTGHEHTFSILDNVLTANYTRWRFQLIAEFLFSTLFSLNLDDKKCIN